MQRIFDVDSSPLATVLEDAAAGVLPDWAVAGQSRERHMRRVAALMTDWARALELSRADSIRWSAAGLLHDVLRDATPAVLLPLVPPPLRDLPPSLLHGPAAGVKLREHGVTDKSLLNAIMYHPIGHPDLDALGRALFVADHIEPGRTHDPQGLAVLRARMPAAADPVVREVLRRRVRYQLDRAGQLRAETIAFWNVLMEAHATAPTV
jgi:HD superfamily phosphohydrolase YqeK